MDDFFKQSANSPCHDVSLYTDDRFQHSETLTICLLSMGYGGFLLASPSVIRILCLVVWLSKLWFRSIGYMWLFFREAKYYSRLLTAFSY